MNQKFEMLEVMRALGVAPSTAGIIAGLLNGKIDPENFRSVEHWPLADLDAPPQHLKVLSAIAELMNVHQDDIRTTKDFEGVELWYLSGFGGQPTVTWYNSKFTLRSVDV
jgi:hypothetical protein